MLSMLLFVLGACTFFGMLRLFLPFVLCNISGEKCAKKRGAWAVVTGATDGIGKAYCFALAKRGLNVVLISRTMSKLEECAAELKAKHKVETKVVAADFSKVQEPGFMKAITTAVADLDVGVLVNNVGMSYSYPCWFAEEDTSEELLASLLQLNVCSTTAMTKLVLPGMVSRKRGAVINLSSAAGNMPCGSPGLAAYSATKAYVTALGKSIAHEVKAKGVTVQTHVPYFVSTKMSKIRKASLMVPSPDAWVDSSLRMLGYGGNAVVPYFMHFIQDFVCMYAPDEIIGGYTLNLHAGIRKKALKKAAAKEAEAAKKD